MPKGSTTTAIGLPRMKRRKVPKVEPFFRKTTNDRQMYLITILTCDGASKTARGDLLTGTDVEINPANLPSCVKDSNIDIGLVKSFLMEEGYTTLLLIYSDMKTQPWKCQLCKNDLNDDQSVGCESCLTWFHFNCAQLKSTPICKYWYCYVCKSI